MSDRKYKHRGYQDSGGYEERKPPARQQPGPKPGPEQGPRGRGLGAPTATVFRCRVCGAKQNAGVSLPLEATCDSCGNDLHTCSNCVNFDPSRPNECRKPILARIASKAKRNACELFAPNTVQEFAQDKAAVSDPRAAFDALFKKK
ncbi:MAG: hypothetical protein ACM3O7_01720 [Acidobacteriota bacterium]